MGRQAYANLTRAGASGKMSSDRLPVCRHAPSPPFRLPRTQRGGLKNRQAVPQGAACLSLSPGIRGALQGYADDFKKCVIASEARPSVPFVTSTNAGSPCRFPACDDGRNQRVFSPPYGGKRGLWKRAFCWHVSRPHVFRVRRPAFRRASHALPRQHGPCSWTRPGSLRPP